MAGGIGAIGLIVMLLAAILSPTSSKSGQLTPAKMVTSTDSCGCKVFTVEVKGRTFVVNNQGGICLVPEKEEGGDASLKMLEQLMEMGGNK